MQKKVKRRRRRGEKKRIAEEKKRRRARARVIVADREKIVFAEESKQRVANCSKIKQRRGEIRRDLHEQRSVLESPRS